ncbi:MAG: PIN domain-containing protein [Chloroflexia bacterium]|nr:PIN domain-containing protein [Chloroflexia bacterium]
MTQSFINADVIIRFLTGDDSTKQAAARRLFDRAVRGELELSTPSTTIADCIHVLTSPKLYRLPRAEVAARLTTLLRVTDVQVPDRRDVLRALDIYGTTNVDFGDAMIAAAMESTDSRVVFSYDRHFDRFPEIDRQEP